MAIDHLSESDIAGFLDHDSTIDERSRVERHLEECPECRHSIVDVRRITSGFKPPSESSPTVRLSVRHRRRWIPLTMGAALAASLAVVWIARPNERESLPNLERDGTAASEGARGSVVVATPEDDEVLPPDSIEFSWRSTGGSLYRLTIQDETGAPVIRRETPDTLIALRPGSVLTPNQLYFWRVDAITDGVTASSPVRKFRVSR